MDRSQSTPQGEGRSFEHQAILYAGTDDFVTQATPLVRSALEKETPALVALTATTLDGLRESLGEDAQRVRWVDITGIGRNPARIIPLWREFVAHHRQKEERPVFGIGEPVYPERTPAELVEAEHHEALLNVAFCDTQDFDLYCPYDVERLDAGVVEAAERTHPHLRRDDATRLSSNYGSERLTQAFTPPLPAVGPSSHLPLEGTPVVEVHRFVVNHVPRLVEMGTSGSRLSHLALAAVAVNAAVRGERLRIWSEDGHVLVEVSGRVPITDPLAGREWPAPAGEPQYGLWLANQLCDLVQWRSDGQHSVVRLRLG